MKDADTGLSPADLQLSIPNAKVEGGKEILYNKIMSYTHDNLAKPIFSLFKVNLLSQITTRICLLILFRSNCNRQRISYGLKVMV
jgi:hypothetical protein